MGSSILAFILSKVNSSNPEILGNFFDVNLLFVLVNSIFSWLKLKLIFLFEKNFDFFLILSRVFSFLVEDKTEFGLVLKVFDSIELNLVWFGLICFNSFISGLIFFLLRDKFFEVYVLELSSFIFKNEFLP